MCFSKQSQSFHEAKVCKAELFLCVLLSESNNGELIVAFLIVKCLKMRAPLQTRQFLGEQLNQVISYQVYKPRRSQRINHGFQNKAYV